MVGIYLSNINEHGKEEILLKEEKPGPKEKKLRGILRNKILFGSFFLLLLFFKHWTGPSRAEVFDVPTTHVDFVGREKELRVLQQRLMKKSSRKINLMALCGEGGIGKSELAIKFANSLSKDFSLIAWIDASHEKGMHHSYLGLGELLDIVEENPKILKEKVHRKLARSKGKPWLLIFNDVREHPELPMRGGAVLMTCRDKGLCPPEAVLELKKSSKEAVLLLSKLTKEKESEAMHQLAKKLDYLPLMMNVVGHYIAETPGITVSNYSEILASLLKTENSPLKKVEFRKRYSRSLLESYGITLQLLEKKHPLSLEFFQEVIFLDPKKIPAEFLHQWLMDRGFDLPQRTCLQGEILRELQNHSLIRFDFNTESFSIHDLLYEALILENRDEEKILKCLQTLMNLECVQKYNSVRKDTIRPFQKVLSHCTSVLDRVKRPNLLATRLSLIVARYFIDTTQSLETARKYLKLAEDWTHELDHPIRGRMYFLEGVLTFREFSRQISEVEQKQKALEALSLFKKAHSIFQQFDSDELYEAIEQNPIKCTKEYQRAICVLYEGQILRALNRFDEAEIKFRQALEAFKGIEENHFDIPRILREQSLMLAENGECQKAIQKMEQVLFMQRGVYKKDFSSHPSAATTYLCLGDLYLKNKEFLQADQAYKKAIEINQEAFQSKVHPFLASLYKKRSESLSLAGKNFSSKKMEKKAQVIQKILDGSHPD